MRVLDVPLTKKNSIEHRIREKLLPFDDMKTWCRITQASEDTASDSMRPLIVLHGGPGCTHDYLLSLADLAKGGRPVIHYDQVGNGRSTHRPDAPSSFWNVDLFLKELDNLLDKLGFKDDYDLFGQSWGGMLAAEHAVRRPKGLKNLIIANAPASMPLWLRAAEGLRAKLDGDTQEILLRHENAGTTDSAEYMVAAEKFYVRHVCRLEGTYAGREATNHWLKTDPTVYNTMNGPNEFHVIGTLKDWSVIEQLPYIKARTLVINGIHDEATDDTVVPFVRDITGATWHQFLNSSHSPHMEERTDFMRVIDTFLEGH